MLDNLYNSKNDSSENSSDNLNQNVAKTPDWSSETMPEMLKPTEKNEINDSANNLAGQAHLLDAMHKIASLPDEHLEALLHWPAESNVDSEAIRKLFEFVRENRPETQVSQSFDVGDYSPSQAGSLLSQLNKIVES